MDDKWKELKPFLSKRIVGQKVALDVISKVVLRAELGLKRIKKPKAGILLLGPTGVGKTEITLSLADFIYGESERVKRFDMAELQQQTSLNWLLGSNRNEQGILGDAIDALNEKGGGILLFDEIEKAHPSLSSVFLAALDAGRISMSNGETKDLSDCYIFFTSNLGAKNAAQMLHSGDTTIQRCVEMAARNYFSPELFARLDEVVVFKRLGYDAQIEICKNILKKELSYLNELLGKELIVSDNVFNFLVKKGYTRDLGARIMKKSVEREIENAIVEWKLNQDTDKNRDTINLIVENFKLKAV